MKPLNKLYLKTFLLTGIPYGLMMLAIYLAFGDPVTVWKFFAWIIFFGGLMSITLVTFHKNRLLKMGISDLTDENLAVSHTKHITSNLNLKEIIEKFKTDPIIGKMKLKEIENGILLSTRMTWMSYGEKIKILLTAIHGDDMEYQVSSTPLMKTILVDYGKNLENVKRIEGILN